jgi:hypothetical protein
MLKKRYSGVKLTEKQRKAFVFLEHHGQRFLVDFGTDNAESKAREIRREQRRKREVSA